MWSSERTRALWEFRGGRVYFHQKKSRNTSWGKWPWPGSSSEYQWYLRLWRKGSVPSGINIGQSWRKHYCLRHLPAKYTRWTAYTLSWTCHFQTPRAFSGPSLYWCCPFCLEYSPSPSLLLPHSRMWFPIHPPLLNLDVLFLMSLPWAPQMDEIPFPTWAFTVPRAYPYHNTHNTQIIIIYDCHLRWYLSVSTLRG